MLSASLTSVSALALLTFASMPPPALGQLADVLQAVQKIDPGSPKELHFDLGEELPEGGHLQGVQWFRKGNQEHLLLSGSSELFSYLVTIDLSDTTRNAAVLTRLLEAPYRHAGGIQVIDGRIAAVGLEDNRTKDISKVWVLDLATEKLPPRPAPLIEIDRRGAIKRSTAGAVAIGRVEDRHLLIVGTWDSATLDFYKSNGHPLSDSRCRFEKSETWDATLADRSDWSDATFGSYQNINLIVDENGRAFLAAFCREGEADLMDLYELVIAADTPTSQRLLKRASRRFHCVKTSFRAGAGVRIMMDGSLMIYACSHQGRVIEWFE